MQRLLQIYGNANNNGVEGNDSVVSSDFNWNEISIGNGTLSEANFFGRKHPEHERKEYMQKIEKKNSVESDDNLSSSFGDELHIDGSQTHKQNGRKPLTQHNLRTPNAYKQGQLYKEKQKLLEKAQLKKDRDQRKFHAKPAPNFNAIHAANSKKRVQEDPKITVPRTPQVIRSHRIYSGMAEAKQKELIESLKPKPFVSKEAEVLKVPPFVLQPKKKTPTELVPFNLHSDERLLERREYDLKHKEEMERKEREKEEKRKMEEENIRRLIRKQTVFKANPNPFSAGK